MYWTKAIAQLWPQKNMVSNVSNLILLKVIVSLVEKRLYIQLVLLLFGRAMNEL